MVDRLGIRAASVLSDLCATALIASIPLLYEVGALHFWLLVALAFLASACEAPGRRDSCSTVPDSVRACC